MKIPPTVAAFKRSPIEISNSCAVCSPVVSKPKYMKRHEAILDIPKAYKFGVRHCSQPEVNNLLCCLLSRAISHSLNDCFDKAIEESAKLLACCIQYLPKGSSGGFRREYYQFYSYALIGTNLLRKADSCLSDDVTMMFEKASVALYNTMELHGILDRHHLTEEDKTATTDRELSSAKVDTIPYQTEASHPSLSTSLASIGSYGSKINSITRLTANPSAINIFKDQDVMESFNETWSICLHALAMVESKQFKRIHKAIGLFGRYIQVLLSLRNSCLTGCHSSTIIRSRKKDIDSQISDAWEKLAELYMRSGQWKKANGILGKLFGSLCAEEKDDSRRSVRLLVITIRLAETFIEARLCNEACLLLLDMMKTMGAKHPCASSPHAPVEGSSGLGAIVEYKIFSLTTTVATGAELLAPRLAPDTTGIQQKALLLLSRAFLLQNRLDAAQQSAMSLLVKLASPGDEALHEIMSRKSEAFSILGQIHMESGKVAMALQYFHEALAHFESLPADNMDGKCGACEVHLHLAKLHICQANTGDARASFKAAESVARGVLDYNRGSGQAGRYETEWVDSKARVLLARALFEGIKSESNNSDPSLIENNDNSFCSSSSTSSNSKYASITLELLRMKLLEDFSIKNCLELRDPRLLAKIYLVCGNLSAQLSKDRAASCCYQKSLELYARAVGNDSLYTAKVQLSMGNLLLSQSKPLEALKFVSMALATVKNRCGNKSSNTGDAHRLMGLCLYIIDDDSSSTATASLAISHIKEATIIYQKVLGKKHPLTASAKEIYAKMVRERRSS